MNFIREFEMHRVVTIAIVALSVLGNHNVLGAQVVPEPAFRARPANIQFLGRNQTINQHTTRDAGASLKTDPELEAILEQADRFKEERQFGIAAKLWQSVLERSGDTLYSSDGQIYYSLARQVEQILAQLPVDGGLDAYRITADANAKEIIAEASDPFDEQALKKVVRKYFLSSLGDDAAMKLSAIYMDQHDFVGAYRMLEKIVLTYPDPNISMVDVHTRMALCQAMMGEASNARLALEKARQVADADKAQGRVDAKSIEQLAAVEKSVSQLSEQVAGRSVAAGFDMALANRNRTGVMPSLPSSYMSHDLEAVWQYYYIPKTTRWIDLRRIKPIVGEDALERAAESVSQRERSLITKWRDQGWRPAGDLVFDSDNVYFKTSIDVSVWNRSAKSDQIVWRPLWQNNYQLDDYTKTMLDLKRRLHRSRRQLNTNDNLPRESYEFQLFTDRIASQMSILNGVLYSIEGSRADSLQVPRHDLLRQARFNIHSRRSRSNRLSAYDARTGKMLWSLPPVQYDDQQAASNEATSKAPEEAEHDEMEIITIEDGTEDEPWLQTGGFMAAPISYAGLIIAPVNHGGAISVYAFDPEQEGKTVWKSYLCDESETGANPYSPINLSIDGSDLFASCGLGVVFIIDPTTGLIRLAKRYDREGVVQFASGRFGQNYKRMNFDSWLTDTILAFGRQMICFSSDASRIEAHNRNSGEIIWWGKVDPLEAHVDYLLGIHNGILYAAGPQTILAFDLKQEGRMLWGGGLTFDGKLSYGRGMLTSDGIYIPVENKILHYSLHDKNNKPELLASVDVNLGTGAPVGNLYSDGQKIWVQGANRVYALGRGTTKRKKQDNDEETD